MMRIVVRGLAPISLRRAVTVLVLLGAPIACARDAVTVLYDTDTAASFASPAQRAIRRIANATAVEVRAHLPTLPAEITLRVRTGSDVIPETRETATAAAPNLVVWIVDPNRGDDVLTIVNAQLRATLFHEFHHLVRDAALPSTTLMDRVVTEGLATAFERDYAGVRVPWGEYPGDVDAWVRELRTLPPDAPREPWLSRHPDGRRWIGLRAGTYLADQAAKRSGRSPAQLASAGTAEILALAGGQ
jgi:hypothetical protein